MNTLAATGFLVNLQPPPNYYMIPRRYGGYEEGWRVRIQTRAEGCICLTRRSAAGAFFGPL